MKAIPVYNVIYNVFLVLTWQSAPFFLAESGSLYCLVSPSHIGVHTFPGENLKTGKTCTPDVLFRAVVQVVYYYLHLTRPDVCFNYVILFPYHYRNRIQTPGISASQLQQNFINLWYISFNKIFWWNMYTFILVLTVLILLKHFGNCYKHPWRSVWVICTDYLKLRQCVINGHLA